MKTHHTISATMLAASLAFGGPTFASDASTGAAIGGLSGALLGSWVGADEHHSRNAILLGLVGAGTGYAIGNENDKAVVTPSGQVVPIVTSAPTRAPLVVSAPNAGGGYGNPSVSYPVRIASPQYAQTPPRCQDVEIDVWMNGRPRVIETMACRQPGGDWVIADGAPGFGNARGHHDRRRHW